MSEKQVGSVLHFLNQLIGTPKESPDSDVQLLERFAGRRDEAAFAELVRRHGRLVWSVCRRLLWHDQDAEDAFQATLLVLANKIEGLRNSHGLAFTPDGKILLASDFEGDTVRFWDSTTGAERRRLECGQKGIVHLALSSDGKLLATAGNDGSIRLWDTRTGETLRRLTGHTKQVWRVAFSPDGKLLASSSEDNTLRLWDEATSRQVWKRDEKLASFVPVAFSPDGTLLASVNSGGTLVLRDAATGEKKRHWQTGSLRVFTMAFAPDGKTIATAGNADSGIRLWQTATGRERYPSDEHRYAVSLLRFTANGKELISYGREGQLLCWNLATKTPRRLFFWDGDSFDVFALSPDGNTLAVGTWSTYEVRSWDFKTGKPGRLLGKHQEPILSLAFSPNGRLLASGGWDKTMHVWDIRDGREILHLKGLPHGVRSLCFAPDSTALAFGLMTHGDDSAVPTLRLLDLANGKDRYTFDLRVAFEGALAFSPDGRILASGHGSRHRPEGHRVCLWDAATGKELCRHTDHREDIGVAAFSPDGKLVASGSGALGTTDNSVQVWEAATGRLIRRFEGHHSCVGGLAFSPDGLVVASGAGDSTILLWDITGRRTDGRWHAKPLTPRQLEACWTALVDEDAAKAYDAVWTFVAASEQAVPFLQKHLPPVPRPDAKIATRLIVDLDSDDFMVRQKATDELSRFGDTITLALRRALDGKPSLEVRRRIQQLLDQTRDWTAERLRDHRAIQALEHVGTAQAKQVLQALAEGTAEARRTEEARAALPRLER